MPATLQANSAKSDDSLELAWSKLASRAVRVALARRDMSYAELARALSDVGVTESARSVEGKIQRGTFRFNFFLQVLAASQADCPRPWQTTLASSLTWDERASAVLRAELAQLPWLGWQQLSNRLTEIGIRMQADSLCDQILAGTFSGALFLQCATVCGFATAQMFVDVSSLNDAALSGAASTR